VKLLQYKNILKMLMLGVQLRGYKFDLIEMISTIGMHAFICSC